MGDGYDWGAPASAAGVGTGHASSSKAEVEEMDQKVSRLYSAGNKLADKKKWVEAEKLYTEALEVFGLGASDPESLPNRRTLDTISVHGRLIVMHLYCNRATAFLARGLKPLGVADTMRACETDVGSPTARFKLGFALQVSRVACLPHLSTLSGLLVNGAPAT